MPWAFPDTFVPLPIIVLANTDYWKNDPELKQRFAIALANNKDSPFKAGCEVFGKETNKALWASVNWLNDPIITETKQKYDEITTCGQKVLDKDQYAAKILEVADERILYNGNEVYALDGKDRIAALKLYGEARGYINNKTEINNNNNHFTKNNFMEIKFVEPEKKEIKTIDNISIQQEENILENSPIKLKLVG